MANGKVGLTDDLAFALETYERRKKILTILSKIPYV